MVILLSGKAQSALSSLQIAAGSQQQLYTLRGNISASC